MLHTCVATFFLLCRSPLNCCRLQVGCVLILGSDGITWSGTYTGFAHCRRRPMSATSGNILVGKELHRPFAALLNRPNSSPGVRTPLESKQLPEFSDTYHGQPVEKLPGWCPQLQPPCHPAEQDPVDPAEIPKPARKTWRRRNAPHPQQPAQPLPTECQLAVQRISGPTGESPLRKQAAWDLLSTSFQLIRNVVNTTKLH